MSVEALTLALHHSRATGTVKLVLIGVCNHAGDGGSWPTIATLARYAGLNGKPENNERVVRRALKTLVELGEIVVVRQAGGTRDCPDYARPNLYRVTLRCPDDCDGTTNHRRTFPQSVPAIPPESDDRGAVQPSPGGPDEHPPGGTNQPPKPSGESSGESSSGPADMGCVPAATASRSRPMTKAGKKDEAVFREVMHLDLGLDYDDEFDRSEIEAMRRCLQACHKIRMPGAFLNDLAEKGELDGFFGSHAPGLRCDPAHAQTA